MKANERELLYRLSLLPQSSSSLENNNEENSYLQSTILLHLHKPTHSQEQHLNYSCGINNNFHIGKHIPLLYFPTAYVTYLLKKIPRQKQRVKTIIDCLFKGIQWFSSHFMFQIRLSHSLFIPFLTSQNRTVINKYKKQIS